MIAKPHQRIATCAALLTGVAFAPPVVTADFYFGDSAVEELDVTSCDGPRADTVGTPTYLLHTTSPTMHTAPSDQQFRFTEVNFFADTSGTLPPFAACYHG